MITFNTQFRPNQIHASVFVAPGAVIVGDVTLNQDCSVWFNAVLRGDSDAITIGAGSNIQDGAILHVDPGYPLLIGAGVTIGHRAIVHGATMYDNALIGMGATILNGAVIGENSLVGANALITEGKEFPPGSLILGSPAKVIRALTPDEIVGLPQSAQTYVLRARAFKSTLG